jgi:hypothetical protein
MQMGGGDPDELLPTLRERPRRTRHPGVIEYEPGSFPPIAKSAMDGAPGGAAVIEMQRSGKAGSSQVRAEPDSMRRFRGRVFAYYRRLTSFTGVTFPPMKKVQFEP